MSVHRLMSGCVRACEPVFIPSIGVVAGSIPGQAAIFSLSKFLALLQSTEGPNGLVSTEEAAHPAINSMNTWELNSQKSH